VLVSIGAGIGAGSSGAEYKGIGTISFRWNRNLPLEQGTGNRNDIWNE